MIGRFLENTRSAHITHRFATGTRSDRVLHYSLSCFLVPSSGDHDSDDHNDGDELYTRLVLHSPFCDAFVNLPYTCPCILLTTYPSRGYVLALIASVYVDLAVLARSFPALSTLPRSVDYILITYVYRHVYLIYLTRGRSRPVKIRYCEIERERARTDK